MAFTYDPTTDIGKIRMLVPDRDSQNYVFQDEEIQGSIRNVSPLFRHVWSRHVYNDQPAGGRLSMRWGSLLKG